MAPPKKYTLFDVAREQGSECSHYDIVIVHPFYSKSSRTGVYRDAFQKFQQRLIDHSVVCDEANIYVFSFKGKDIIKDKITIQAVADELTTRLGERRTSRSPDSSGPAHSRPDQQDTSQFISRKIAEGTGDGKKAQYIGPQPGLLFICHSLGAWVVKTALLQNNEPNISILKTQGLIVLDTPNPEQLSEDYILSFSRLVSGRISRSWRDTSETRKELVSRLKDTDKNYHSGIQSHYVQEDRLKDQMKADILSERYDLWLSKNTDEMASQVSAAPKLTTLWQKLTRIITTNQSYDLQLYGNAVQALEKLQLEEVVATWINKTNARRRESVHLPGNVLPSMDSVIPESHDSNTQRRPSSQSSWTPGLLGKKRMSTFSSDSTFKSESDRLSIGSAANIPILQSGHGADELTLRQNIEMGKSFMRKGELDNAGTAFQRASAILGSKSKMQELNGYSLEVDAHLACIALYRGKYEKAYQTFEALLSSPIQEGRLKNEFMAALHRWIGVALLHQGKYESAIAKFQLLLTQFIEYSRDEIQIRRDLALASAYSGNFDEAFGELEKAHQCLEIMEQRQALEQDTSKKIITTQKEETSVQSLERLPFPHASNAQDRDTTSSIYLPSKTPSSSELKAKKDGLSFAKAKIGLAWGSFDLALVDSEQALRGMKKRLGPGHFKTLECASLNAMLLALNSQTRAAETACVATHRAMTAQLGPQHPFTLESMSYLVRIYQMQSRFLEALDTAKSLARIVKSTQTEKRPQALQSRCIRAESELKIGEYRNAEFELETIMKHAKDEFRDNRLENLDHQTTLVLAYYHCGKNQAAEIYAGRVLRDQLKIYITRHAHKKHIPDQSDNEGEHITSQVARLINIASLEQLDQVITELIDKRLIPRLRPPILRTLRIISLILQEKEDAVSLGSAIKLLQALWDRFDNGSQADSQDALRIRYDLALAIRHAAETEISDEDKDQRLEQSLKHLRHVYRSRSRVLGHTNPETLSAKLEFIITNCALGRWAAIEDPTIASETDEQEPSSMKQEYCPLDSEGWALVKSESRMILDLHEAQLGENHPDTLKSLMWVLAVQTLLRNMTAATQTSEEILKRLRLKIVREQRPVDSINLERKLALIVSEISKERAGDILRETEKAIRDSQPWMPEKWRMLEKMVHEERQHLENIN